MKKKKRKKPVKMKRNRINQILIVAFFGLFFFSCGKTGSEEGKSALYSGNNVVETGELVAVNSQAFILPKYGRYWHEMRIIGLLDHGEIVSAGDSIIQLDPSDVKKSIVDWETNLETQLANLEKLTVDHQNQRNEMDSRMRSELASFDLKKIELEASRFEAERFRRIKELEFRQAEITLEKEKRRVELNEIIAKNEYRIQEIRVEQIRTRIKNAYEILPQLTIRTPIPGVFQIGRNRRNRTMLKIGDEVYPGNTMASVPELKWMKVNTFINENDFLKLKLGQKVAVRLDAMPKLVFDGEIAHIGKLCRTRDWESKEKGFDVEVNILAPDERLKPGMTVSCEFLQEN